MYIYTKHQIKQNIEDIYFFEVNTEIYFIECVENSDVFNSQDETFLEITEKKYFFFYFILFIGYMQCLTHCKKGAKMQNEKFQQTQIILAPKYSSGTK